ncbi:MAG: asparaginase [Catonella sp.]
MKTILMLTTGGTIASVITPYGLIPTLNSEELLSYLPKLEEDIQINTRELYSIDSTNTRPEHWLLIAKAVEAEYENYDGFVICHGTDTMAYTASALSYLIQNSPKPIVLTGAQKPIGMEITDAKSNLRDSILYAADDNSCGVQIVFSGKVILGTRAKKTRTFSFEAFSSINYPFIAEIYDGKIIRYISQNKNNMKAVFYHNLNEKVYVMKLIPGISDSLISTIFKNYDGIILESFGTGGIPDSIQDTIFKNLDKYPAKDKVLVITTQVQNEGSDTDIYEVGVKLKKYKYLEAGDMTLEATLTKLMWVLANKERTWDYIEKSFNNTVSFDRVRE